MAKPEYRCEEFKNALCVALRGTVSTGVTGLSSIVYEKDAVLPVAVTSTVKLLDVTPVALVIVGVPIVGAGGGVDTTNVTAFAEPDEFAAVTLKIYAIFGNKLVNVAELRVEEAGVTSECTPT